MRRIGIVFVGMVLAMALVVPVSAKEAVVAKTDDMAAKLNEVLMKGPAEGHWQVKPDDLDAWIKAKKTDFLVVDVRPTPPGQQGGRIPGSVYIPYNEILKPENLKKSRPCKAVPVNFVKAARRRSLFQPIPPARNLAQCNKRASAPRERGWSNLVQSVKGIASRVSS